MALNYIPEVTASMGVTSLDRSIDWYQSVLGFTLLYRVDEIGWCELATAVPGVNVGLSQNVSVTCNQCLGGG
jgi:Glyoxalase/Bleomycin resistance protein/Dioxygenase superfamily